MNAAVDILSLSPRVKSFIDLAVEELRRHVNEQLALVERSEAAPARATRS